MDRMTAWLYDPNAKPSKESSKHDQKMIQLGWDAARTFEPQPDQSRLLTEEEIRAISLKWGCSANIWESEKQVAKAQVKKLLLSISKESKRMDGTTYLVPDYTKFREALKEFGIEEA